MIIIEKNSGQKIQWEQNGYVVSFANGELALNCQAYQRDWAVHLDICSNDCGQLVIGTQIGSDYVAELDIPSTEYIYPEAPEEFDGESEMNEAPAPVFMPLDMGKVTLSLWAIAQ
jgi:hypothetical protein